MSIANVSTFQKEDKEEFEQCLLLFFDSSQKNFRVVYVYMCSGRWSPGTKSKKKSPECI
jgi:hypothetical protein